LFTADGALDSDDLIEEGDASRWFEGDVHILSRAAVNTVQYNFKNGLKVILGPLEYECSLCGEYSHAEATCPELCDMDDPFDEADYDDLPAVDES
jgi:hypothetical protein